MISELPDIIEANIHYFSGRTWLLPELVTWLEQTQERIFLLTGGPGTGKSMLAAWLAGAGPVPMDPTAQAELEKIRSQVRAAHFFLAASRNTSPRALAESIAHQLVQQVPEFSVALAACLAERVLITVSQRVTNVTGGSVTGITIGRLDLNSLQDEESFDRVFTQPIKQLYSSGYSQPSIFLFDALDEAQTYHSSKNAVQLLSELTDLPAEVRFIVTTRSDPRVLKYFHGCKSLDLITDMPDEAADIRTYAACRLATVEPALLKEQQDDLAERISGMAKGVFLYAQAVVEDVLAHPSNLPDLETYPLPEGLSSLYQTFLNRELGRDEDQWYATFRPILGLIAVSRGAGFTQTQLQRITRIMVERPLRICKQYLAGDLPEGPFRIFDRSFAEFLLEDSENRDYHIAAQEMHRLITDYYINSHGKNWLGCDSYGLHYIVEHAIACGLNDQDRKTAFDRILTDDFVNAIQSKMGWLYTFIEDLENLASVEPGLVARLCFTLILERSPNSLVIQHSLRLLVRLRAAAGLPENPGTQREKSLERVIQIVYENDGDVPGRLEEVLEQETDSRIRGVIALALAETKNPAVTPTLLKMFREEFGEASWAAADALIYLNDRSIIPKLIDWYQELKKRDRRSCARKQRIIYVLGWMHAEEAKVLKSLALAASDPKIIGRAVDLTWLLQPDEADDGYLRDQMQRILASSPQHPKELGPWADEWLQKRLVRALQGLGLVDILPDLRRLQEHIRKRPSPKSAKSGAEKWELGIAKRNRLVEAVEEAITELQVGR